MRLQAGMTAVVTGAASGIGRALAERFAVAGLRVVLADVEEGALERAVAELRDSGHEVLGVGTDVMSRVSVEALAERAASTFADVHVLCNNAGVLSASTGAVWELPEADWEWVLGVNFRGVLHGVQAFVPRMLAQGSEGHVVNTASIFGLLPARGPYDVSKHAVVALSEALRTDLRSRSARVSVSVVCPGLVQTGLASAERNRGAGLGERQEANAIVSLAIAKGIAASEVADAVFEAVEGDRFWVLTHRDLDAAVRARVEEMLGGAVAAARTRRRRREAGA
ncbi:MAG: SDR family NAD(P)-dependent oxidoreductase [Dehalococcoidia bacterium]